jgi:hypothetical protein
MLLRPLPAGTGRWLPPLGPESVRSPTSGTSSCSLARVRGPEEFHAARVAPSASARPTPRASACFRGGRRARRRAGPCGGAGGHCRVGRRPVPAHPAAGQAGERVRAQTPPPWPGLSTRRRAGGLTAWAYTHAGPPGAVSGKGPVVVCHRPGVGRPGRDGPTAAPATAAGFGRPGAFQPVGTGSPGHGQDDRRPAGPRLFREAQPAARRGGGNFDRCAEDLGRGPHADGAGRGSVPPGVSFRIPPVGRSRAPTRSGHRRPCTKRCFLRS